MLLYHYTNSDEMDSFMQKGLVFGSQLEGVGYAYGTGPINGVLNCYKPTNLPAFINRDACLFFYPVCQYGRFGNGEIKVDTANLTQERLFVADLKKAQEIWQNTVHASYGGETSGIPLSKSAKGYWDSLIPFATYQKNPQLIKELEVLYFGDIPFTDLEFSTELHPIVERVFRTLGSRYHITRENALSGRVYFTEKQYVAVEYSSFSGKLIVSSKAGAIDKDFIGFLEEMLQSEVKHIKKNGHKMIIKYVL